MMMMIIRCSTILPIAIPFMRRLLWPVSRCFEIWQDSPFLCSRMPCILRWDINGSVVPSYCHHAGRLNKSPMLIDSVSCLLLFFRLGFLLGRMHRTRSFSYAIHSILLWPDCARAISVCQGAGSDDGRQREIDRRSRSETKKEKKKENEAEEGTAACGYIWLLCWWLHLVVGI